MDTAMISTMPLSASSVESSVPCEAPAKILLKEEFALLATELHRALSDLIGPVSRRFDITGQQLMALVILREKPHAKMSEVSEALGILRPNFTALANKLEKLGFVERVRGESDRRLCKLSLTPRGEEVVLALEKSLEAKDKAIESAIEPQLYEDAVRGVRALRAIARVIVAEAGR